MYWLARLLTQISYKTSLPSISYLAEPPRYLKGGERMSVCEKCWGRAYIRSLSTGKPQVECYQEILKETKDNPCSLKEQAGEDEVSHD